ncbi:MAG: hypothetical protein PHX34_03995 [Candidatus Shapirobacteria bacterium]|nr:hypothetical protein [Candidatus Shapirobacteria bacterium]
MKTKNKKSFPKLLISIPIVIIILIGVSFLINPNKNKKEEISSVEEIAKIVKNENTNNPEENLEDKNEEPNLYIPPAYQSGPYTVLVKEDKQNNTVNLILQEGGKETIIESIKSSNTFKGTFSEFLMSSNNKYLHYVAFLNPDYFQSRIYNVENKEKNNLSITAFDKGFTNDNKYFYGCSEDGLIDGGIEIYNLEQMKIQYQKPNGLMKCEYSQQENNLKVTYSDGQNKNFKYSFSTNTVN